MNTDAELPRMMTAADSARACSALRMELLEAACTPEQADCHFNPRRKSSLDKPEEREMAVDQGEAESCLPGWACLQSECQKAVEFAAGQIHVVTTVRLHDRTDHHDTEHLLVERRLGQSTVRLRFQLHGGKKLESLM